MDDLQVQKQLELEHGAVEQGIRKYRKAVADRPLSDLPPGLALMKLTLEPLTKAIYNFTAEGSSNMGRFLGHTKRFIKLFNPDDLAYITSKVCLNSISKKAPAQEVALDLTNALIDHLEYLKFKEQNPKVLRFVEENILHTANKKHRRTVIMLAKRRNGVEDAVWPRESKLQFGVKMLDMFIQSTGLLERVSVRQGKKTTILLRPTERTRDWIERQHARCELLDPVFQPMVIPPIPWDSPLTGGFLGHGWSCALKLVKTYNNKAVDELEHADMSKVYRTVNALQQTPWKINSKILGVLRETFMTGHGMAGLPEPESLTLPPKPWKDDEEFKYMKANHPEVVKEWKVQASRVHDYNVRMPSKRYSLFQKIALAEKFVDESQIFFVWTMDWRGRLYPVQSYINPQSDDSGKSLLLFAKGMPLTKEGADWLAVHLANEFGVDKVSFEDRIKWVKDNEQLILDSAENPLDGERFWTKADSPFMFLAACMEWLGFKKEGDGYISHLPINFDGSNNGLQHLSCLLLDEVGGKATNLIPQEVPADVYQEVANEVIKAVERDALYGDDAVSEVAKLWLGRIDRKMVKRNVMTVPYGATKYGMRDQIRAELKSRQGADGTTYLGVKDETMPAIYLADKTYGAIGHIVIAARRAMDWLQEVAKVAADANIPIIWTTPAGFKVYHSYRKMDYKRIDTFWGGCRVRLGLPENTDKVDKRRQALGISPNFVHSCDAAHLQLTVNRCLDDGITDFMMIHDSYGTHACNCTKLAKNIREAFVGMYSERDVLGDFLQEVKAQLPESFWDKLPKMPVKGMLDVSGVRDSRYFFA